MFVGSKLMEIRWYKGKHKVAIIKKSKGNYLVKVLESIIWETELPPYLKAGSEFTTVPRLLWRNPRRKQKK